MWTILASIFALVTAAVSLLCMVSSSSKSEEREIDEEDTEEIEYIYMEEADPEANFTDGGMQSTEKETKKKCVVEIAELNCSSAFNDLNPRERLYAHYTAKAYFEGALLKFIQISPDAAATFILLFRIFSFDSIATLKQKADDLEITEIEWQGFLEWAAVKLTVDSCDNIYLRMPDENLMKLIAASTASTIYPDLCAMYESIAKDESPPDDMNATCRFILIKRNLIGFNCRGYNEFVDGKDVLKIRVASTNFECAEKTIYGVKVQIEKGEYSKLLDNICTYLKLASEHASGVQKAMLGKYMEYFRTGQRESYQNAKKLRGNDQKSTVRSDYSFFNNPFAPPNDQSKFDGIVSVVNKEATKKYARLVSHAKHILTKLPWGEDYEKNIKFEPGFAVSDAIAMGFTDRPSFGYNCTNEETMGQSNVFSNVIYAIGVGTAFIKEEDWEMLRKYNLCARELSFALHEIFGHGSGKLFKRFDDGTFNFDKETKDILTGSKIGSWYKPDESYKSVFGDLAVAFEECRAFAIEYLLGADKEVLRMMGYKGTEAQSIKYVIWLNLVSDALCVQPVARSFRDKNWKNDHDWARSMLLRVILQAGRESSGGRCVTIEKAGRKFYIHLNMEKIDTEGVPAVREFLKKLQAYKSTADVKGAIEMFNEYIINNDNDRLLHEASHSGGGGWRKMFVQPNTVLNDEGGVDLLTYDETHEGIIESVIDRYTIDSVHILEELWQTETALQKSLDPTNRNNSSIRFAPGVMHGRHSQAPHTTPEESTKVRAKTPFWWMQ